MTDTKQSDDDLLVEVKGKIEGPTFADMVAAQYAKLLGVPLTEQISAEVRDDLRKNLKVVLPPRLNN
jgi:hypothetical protein